MIHPQNIIHSMVEFIDGSVMAQMGVPDMRLPILYALTYPNRFKTNLKSLDLLEVGSLTLKNLIMTASMSFISLPSYENREQCQ